MGPRDRFNVFFDKPLPGQGRGRVGAPFLKRLSTELRAWHLKILLPHLNPVQRVEASTRDLPGLHQLLRSMAGVLSEVPELAAGLQLTTAVIDALRQKDVQLHVIIGHSGAIAQSAAVGKRLSINRVKDATEHLLSTARRLQLEALDPADRARARDVLTAVDTFLARRERSRKARQIRVERRLAPLQTRLLQKDLDPAVALPSPTLIIAPGPAPGQAPDPDMDEDEGPIVTPPATRSTRRADPTPDFSHPGHAPASQFLDGPLVPFGVCAATLGQAREALTKDGEPTPPDAVVDYLYYMELGSFLIEAIDGFPLLQTEAGVSPKDLAALCEECTANSHTEISALHLIQGAQDGHLCISIFANLCYEDMESWLKTHLGNSKDPTLSEPLRTWLLALSDVRNRAMERAKEHGKQTQAQLADLQARISRAEADANLSRVKDRLARGQKVPPKAFTAASERQEEIAAEAAAEAAELANNKASRKHKR